MTAVPERDGGIFMLLSAGATAKTILITIDDKTDFFRGVKISVKTIKIMKAH